MRFVTHTTKEEFDLHGQRLIDSWTNAPADAELWWYTQGHELPDIAGITVIPDTKVNSLVYFRERYGRYKSPDYPWDAVGHSAKVFCAYDALSDQATLGAWIDPSCHFKSKIPITFMRELLPRGYYIGLFKRTGAPIDTLFWIVDCANDNHEAFLSTWLSWYETDAFKSLPQWNDAKTLEANLRKMEKSGTIRSLDLSGKFGKELHPIEHMPIGEYIGHS